MDITLDNYYNYTIEDIKNIPDLALQKAILEKIKEDFPSKSLFEKFYEDDMTILELAESIEKYYQENTSNYFAPGDLVFFYPIFEERKSMNLKTSDLSGGYIYPNTSYYIYYFLLWNKSQETTYILNKKLNLCLDELDLMPFDLKSFEYFEQCLAQAYSNGDEEFYNYSAELGFESFPLRRLGKSRRRKNDSITRYLG